MRGHKCLLRQVGQAIVGVFLKRAWVWCVCKKTHKHCGWVFLPRNCTPTNFPQTFLDRLEMCVHFFGLKGINSRPRGSEYLRTRLSWWLVQAPAKSSVSFSSSCLTLQAYINRRKFLCLWTVVQAVKEWRLYVCIYWSDHKTNLGQG